MKRNTITILFSLQMGFLSTTKFFPASRTILCNLLFRGNNLTLIIRRDPKKFSKESKSMKNFSSGAFLANDSTRFPSNNLDIPNNNSTLRQDLLNFNEMFPRVISSLLFPNSSDFFASLSTPSPLRYMIMRLWHATASPNSQAASPNFAANFMSLRSPLNPFIYNWLR